MTTYFTRQGSEISASDVVSTDGKGACSYKYTRCCSRCGGLGGSDAWKHTGWTCYLCGGQGRWTEQARGYDAEKLAKLNAAAAKREAKREAAYQEKRRAEMAAAIEFLTQFEINHPGLYAYAVEKAKTSDFAAQMVERIQRASLITRPQIDVLVNMRQKDVEAVQKRAASQHIGEEGVRMYFEGTIEKVIEYVGTDFVTGRSIAKYITILRTPEGNAVKYFGACGAEGDKLHGKATIKGHEVYKDEQITIVQRPKFELV